MCTFKLLTSYPRNPQSSQGYMLHVSPYSSTLTWWCFMSPSFSNTISQIGQVTCIQLSELTWDSRERLDCCSWVTSTWFWSSLPVLNKELQKGHSKTCSRLPLNISECSNSWCKFNSSVLSKLLSHSEQAKHSGDVHRLSPIPDWRRQTSTNPKVFYSVIICKRVNSFW